MGIYCIMSLHNNSEPRKRFLPPFRPWGTFSINNFPVRLHFAETAAYLDYMKKMLIMFSWLSSGDNWQILVTYIVEKHIKRPIFHEDIVSYMSI